MKDRRVVAILVAAVILAAVGLWAGGRAGAQDGEGDAGRRVGSGVATDGMAPDRLSPPDSDAARSGSEEDAPPVSPDGVVLRDLRLTGSALRPRVSGVGYTWGRGGGCVYTTDDALAVWNAPLTLPDGAKVNTVRMYYDDRSDLNSTGWFTVYDQFGAVVEEWGMDSSGNSGNGFADTFPVIDHTIDYSRYSYALTWRPLQQGVTMQLCGFRIFYEPPPFGLSFLPLVAGQ